MKSIKTFVAALLVASPVAATEANAAYPSLAGLWTCYSGSRDMSNRRGSFILQFQMRLDAGGYAVGAGILKGAIGSQQIRFQGRYYVNGRDFGIRTGQFTFFSRLVSMTHMAHRTAMSSGNFLNTGCSKVG